MGKNDSQYTDRRLYGPTGKPEISDIDQDVFLDCFLLAPMGALAAQQPDRIREAIRYTPDPSTPDSGIFHVTLHQPGKGGVQVEVRSSDVQYNINRDGGSAADNKSNAPLWPAVLETGFVKLYGMKPGETDLKSAFKLIETNNGGAIGDGMFVLTGEAGKVVRIGESPPPRADGKPLSAPPGSSGEIQPFSVKTKGSYVSDENAAFTEVRSALDAGRPITLSTMKKEVDDGLMEHHGYMVTDIQKQNGHVWVTLRNPYGENLQEGAPERADTLKPEIRMRLDRMVDSGAFGEFNIGPAPRMQAQQQGAPEPTTQSAPANRDPRNPEHPDHKLYKQIEAGVTRIDTAMGRSFDAASERLTMGIFYDAKAAGITSADHIAMNEVGKRQPDGSQAAAGTTLFVVQGQDPSDPAARRSVTDVKQALEQPVEQSLQKGNALEQQQVQSRQQTQTQQQGDPAQDGPVLKGPKL